MQNKAAYIWNFTGRLSQQIIFLLSNIILARILTPDDFGIVGVLAVFLSVATTLSEAGFGGSLIREKHLTKEDISTVFVFNIVVCILIYIILYCAAPAIELYFKVENLTKIARFSFLSIVASAIEVVPNALMLKELRFKETSIALIVSGTLSSLIAIVAAMLGAGVYSIILYQIFIHIIKAVIFYYLTKYRPALYFSVKSFKKLFSFGFYTTVCSIIDSAYENILTFLFGKFITIGSAGYLYQAKKLETAATGSLVSTVNTASFPLLTKIDDKQKFVKECDSIFSTFSLIIFPLLWIATVYSTEIIILIFGKNWSESGIYLSILMIAGTLYIYDSLVKNFIKSLGDVKQLSSTTLIKRIVGLGSILVCLAINPGLMLIGYIISCLIGYLFNLYLYSKLIGRTYIRSLWFGVRVYGISTVLLFALILSKQLHVAYQLLIGLVSVFGYYCILLPRVSDNNILHLIRSIKHRRNTE